MLQHVPNEDYQYGNARIEAFMKYIQDIINRRNIEILYVTFAILKSKEIPLVSVKDIFTKLILHEEWNLSAQLDCSEKPGLNIILFE